MIKLTQMDTIQIEITNACIFDCANCTRFVKHVKIPFMMTFEKFKQAVDSMDGFPNMVGIQGGEPLLHPDFEQFCKYLSSKFPKEKCGLWTTLPPGYEKYRELIVDTFYHIFINDHSRSDILHHPTLVAIKDVIKDEGEMWQKIDDCWAQRSWSASINPKGAFFCEMAASLSMLYKDERSEAWAVEKDWWKRIPKDYTKQMEQWCPQCGMACDLKRRSSQDIIDDISRYHYEKLRVQSSKVKKGKFLLHDNIEVRVEEMGQMAAYKDTDYRNEIAKRYGMAVHINEYDFWTPTLIDDSLNTINTESLYDRIKKRNQ